jgi:hypothetical protein
MLKVLFIVTLYFMAAIEINSHKWCNGPKSTNITKVDLFTENEKRFLQGTTWSPIRIYVDYSYLNSQTSVDPSLISAVKNIVDQSVSLFSKLLKVKSSSKNLIISSNCEGITPAKNVSTTGIATDIIIFPYFDLKADAGTEAYAGVCVQDATTNRPLAGFMAFTSNLKLNQNWLEYNTYLCFHEMTHIFVFNSDLFPSFIDANGKPLGISNIYVNNTVNGVSRIKLKTPKLLAAAQKHFNCSSLDGVELENQGGSGTAGSHWEARIMLTDFMMGQSYDEVTLSDISLALFEDSGWYQVNYYTGGLFRFGKNEGCGFLNTPCIQNQKSAFPRQFCDSINTPMCSNGRVSKGMCDLTTSNKITPSNFIYFSTNSWGGYMLADYCPVSMANSASGVYLPYSCVFGLNNQYPKGLEESVSDTSACFISSLVNNDKASTAQQYVGSNRAICYQYTCNTSAKTISVQVGSSSATCPTSGGTTTINNYSGTLYCPDYNSLCTFTSPCKSMVDCVLKQITASSDTNTYNYQTNYTVPTSSSSSGSTSNGGSSTNTNITPGTSGSGSTSGSGNTPSDSSSNSNNTPNTTPETTAGNFLLSNIFFVLFYFLLI